MSNIVYLGYGGYSTVWDMDSAELIYALSPFIRLHNDLVAVEEGVVIRDLMYRMLVENTKRIK